MKGTLFCLLLIIPFLLFGQHRTDNSLNSEWKFATDPVKVGEKEHWQDTSFSTDRFDNIKVPHCFSTDPRYFFYTGTAWYFKQFELATPGDKHIFLKFDAVFYKSKIWLNGILLGTHEGGYTPFEFDITTLLKSRNTLALQVDNSWDTTTIPGAKTDVPYSPANQSQLYPWINYGGITRQVHLISRPTTYISNTKIIATPDLPKGDATIRIKAFIRNNSAVAITSAVNANIYRNGKKSSIRFKPQSVTLGPGSVVPVELTGTLPASEVTLWSPDAPALYRAAITSGRDTIETTFGIRKIEVSGTQLLLNGEPLKMGGCNRPLDYPGYGSMDPE